MTRETGIRIDGEVYLTLEVISDCYECEVTWLRSVYEAGLLGRGLEHEGTLVLQARVLDRVAEVVRLTRHQGLEVTAVAGLLGVLEEEVWWSAPPWR